MHIILTRPKPKHQRKNVQIFFIRFLSLNNGLFICRTEFIDAAKTCREHGSGQSPGEGSILITSLGSGHYLCGFIHHRYCLHCIYWIK